MILKVKDMDIATGGPQIAIINEKDSRAIDLYYGDRIRLRHKNRFTIAIINIAESRKAVPAGQIGLYEEVLSKLHVKEGSKIEINIQKKPASIQYIKKKLNGIELSEREINEIVDDIVHNRLSDVELSYFVSACHTNIMSMKETIFLTKAMINTGDILKLKHYPVIDKHCVGGVPGNRTTLVLVPILAVLGLTVPKTSSRSITSPAGTADTMEVLAKVAFSLKKAKKIIEKTNAFLIWGGSINLAPADERVIKVEHPLSIDTRSQLLASIMAKKASVSATHLLVDIPVGKEAKIETREQAIELKKQFEIIGKNIGIKVRVIITDGSQPIGNGLGPALEARDVLWILSNDKRAPSDLKRKSVYMAGLILETAGKARKGMGRKMAVNVLNSGRAYKKFMDIIKEQGGKQITAEKIKLGRFRFDFKSAKDGVVNHLSISSVSKVARSAGAPSDKGAGIYFHRHKGDKVRKGETLFTVYSNSIERLNFTKEFTAGCFVVK